LNVPLLNISIIIIIYRTKLNILNVNVWYQHPIEENFN